MILNFGQSSWLGCYLCTVCVLPWTFFTQFLKGKSVENNEHGGYENGQDWLDDLFIENYLLNKRGKDDDKKSNSFDPRCSARCSDL